MHVSDPFDLERFETAQAPVFDAVLDELRAGRKRTHYMWFIFPQLRGLGRSPLAQFYGIGSLHEARDYLAHAVLGPRLERCTQYVLATQDESLHELFGSPDDVKFRSSMTLFYVAANRRESVFEQALQRFWGGAGDMQTMSLLKLTP